MPFAAIFVHHISRKYEDSICQKGPGYICVCVKFPPEVSSLLEI